MAFDAPGLATTTHYRSESGFVARRSGVYRAGAYAVQELVSRLMRRNQRFLLVPAHWPRAREGGDKERVEW